MSALDALLVEHNQFCEYLYCTIGSSARTELEQLRAQAADYQCAFDAVTKLDAQVAEQVRQLDAALEQARIVICAYRALRLGPAGYCSYPMIEQHEMASNWLAAQAEQA